MIALPPTRCSSAGNRQVLLTNNSLLVECNRSFLCRKERRAKSASRSYPGYATKEV